MRTVDGVSTSGISGRKAAKCQDEVLASCPPSPNSRGVKLRVSLIALRLAGKCDPETMYATGYAPPIFALTTPSCAFARLHMEDVIAGLRCLKPDGLPAEELPSRLGGYVT